MSCFFMRNTLYMPFCANYLCLIFALVLLCKVYPFTYLRNYCSWLLHRESSSGVLHIPGNWDNAVLPLSIGIWLLCRVIAELLK